MASRRQDEGHRVRAILEEIVDPTSRNSYRFLEILGFGNRENFATTSQETSNNELVQTEEFGLPPGEFRCYSWNRKPSAEVADSSSSLITHKPKSLAGFGSFRNEVSQPILRAMLVLFPSVVSYVYVLLTTPEHSPWTRTAVPRTYHCAT